MWWLMRTGPAWSWRQALTRGGAMATTGGQQRTQQMREHGKQLRWRQGMVHLCLDLLEGTAGAQQSSYPAMKDRGGFCGCIYPC